MGDHLRVTGVSFDLRFGDDPDLRRVHYRDHHGLVRDIVHVPLAAGGFHGVLRPGVLVSEFIDLGDFVLDGVLHREVAVDGYHGEL